MSGPVVEALDLEGRLSVLSAQLTKVKSLKTKKLNAWRKTIERFKVDQNNQELLFDIEEEIRFNQQIDAIEIIQMNQNNLAQ